MIGEEFYAGAAALSKEPVIYGSVVSQDITRVVFVILCIIGALLNTAGSSLLVDMLKF
jgi:hypothetical protein